MKFYSFVPVVLFLLLSSCNGNSLQRNVSKKSDTIETSERTIQFVNSLRLKSPQRDDLYALGAKVEIEMTPRKRAEAIDSVQFWGDEELIGTIKKEPWTMNWFPGKKRMGKHELKVLAFHTDGTVGLVSTYINVKSDTAPVEYNYKIVNSFPHDKRAYTQGLFFHEGYLYEGTGQNGESSLRKVKLENGEVLSIMNLEQKYFGEGITYYKGKIIQLTWTSEKAFVINAETFEQEDVFYPKTTNRQSWGITTMNGELVVSDGTNILSVIDPKSYATKRIIEVYDDKGKVTNLNELEYIQGKIFANVWLTDRIVIIDPESGRVEGNIDLESILKVSVRNELNKGDDVLNGIAWDSLENRMFVTGKRWSDLFEIEISKK